MFSRILSPQPFVLVLFLAIVAMGFAQEPAGVDFSFGTGGKTILTLPGFTTQTYAIDRQADGKLVVVGQAWGGGTTYRIVLARMNSDGSSDSTFGINGFTTFGPVAGFTYAARAVKVLSDGKILVAGDASGYVMTVRFLANGTVDGSYNVTSVSLGTNAQVTSMALQSDGKCLISANALRFGSSDNEGNLLRFNPSGTVDTSFASSGRFTFGGIGEQTIAAVVVQADGKILHAGTSNAQDMYVGRLLPNGSLETSFRSSGRVIISADGGTTPEGARGLCLDADGCINVVGYSNPGAANDIVVARLTPAGFLDTTFSGDGWLLTNFGGASGVATSVAVQGDGRILISGHRPTGGPTGFALRRFLWTGDDDTTFDGDGLISFSVGTSTADTAGMLVQPDGRIVVTGSALEGGFLRGSATARLLPGPPLEGDVIVITQDLEDKMVPPGAAVTFSIGTASSVPLIYSWYQNDVMVARNTSSNYVIPSAHIPNEGNWRVEVRHGAFEVWSSTVTLKVVSPPLIAGQFDRERRVVVGGSAQFTVNFSGRSPFTCKWMKGDTEVQSVVSSSSSSTLTLFSVTETQEGTYRLVVSNADGSAESQDFLLVVRPDPFVDQTNSGYLVELGGSELLRAWAYASSDYRLQWSKNGVSIANANESSYRIEPALLNHAGSYTLAVHSLKGTAVSAVVKVGVVDTAPGSHIAALMKKFVMPLKVAGPDLTYEWFKDDEPVSASDRITGVNSPSLTFKTIIAPDAGEYTCKVSGYGLTITSGIQTLLVVSAPPELSGFSLPQAQIGVRYDYEPALPSLATAIEITNLPAGLNYSKAANRITGFPSRPGTFEVRVVGVNPAGKSGLLKVPLVVASLPGEMEGRFFGQVVDDNGVEGWLDVTITAGGAYSGKVQLCNMNGALSNSSFRGVIASENGPTGQNPVPERFVCQTSATVGAIYPRISGPATVNVTVTTSYLEVVILVPYKLADGYGEAQGYLTGVGVPCPWSARQPLPAAYLGGFNVGFTPDAGSEPSGFGHAKATVAKTGNLILAGKLADGTALTASGPVASGDYAWGICFLYGCRGRAMFYIELGAGSVAPDYLDASVGGVVFWSKTANPASISSYPRGFATTLTVEAAGKYLRPNVPVLTGPLVMNGRTGPDNVVVSIFSQDTYGTLGSNHSVKFGRGLDVNPYSFTALSFNAATGTFTGSSSHSYQEERYDSKGNPYTVTVRRPFTVQGMVFRPPNSLTSYAVGYTLVSEPDRENPARRTMVSYPVSISPN